ncbi:MAG: FecR domain-containing protein, partial [Bdellovibrionales bacterium]
MQILMGLIQSLAVFGFFIQISTVQAKPVVDKKYPRILEVEGVVFDLARSGSRPLSKNDRILESFHPTTQSDSKMIVAINPQLTLELDENSELVLPAISWETRQVSEIRIVKGRVHIEASERQKILKVKSELFESEIPPGHFIFEINQAEAKAQLMVLEGELSFGALNADETVKLKSGEKVAF